MSYSKLKSESNQKLFQVNRNNFRHITELKTDQSSSTCVYSLASKAWSASLPSCSLPQPNIVAGLSSDILTLAQIRGQQALLIVSYTDVMAVDSLTMAPFDIFHKMDVVSKAGIKKRNDIAELIGTCKTKVNSENMYL